MTSSIKKTCLVILIAFSSGCSSTSNHPLINDPSSSRALNIARAADIRGVKDSKVSLNDYKTLRSGNIAFDAGWAWTNYVSPAPGVSSGAALGLGIATMLFPHKSPAAISSLMAWLPAEEASNIDDARQKIREAGSRAIERTLKRLNITYTGPDIQETHLLGSTAVFHIKDEKYGCAVGKNSTLPACSIVISIDYVTEAFSPAALTGTSYPAYALRSSSTSKRSFLKINSSAENNVDQTSLYLEISRDMPAWMVNYIAPKQSFNSNRAKNPFPFVTVDGEMELFIITKQRYCR